MRTSEKNSFGPWRRGRMFWGGALLSGICGTALWAATDSTPPTLPELTVPQLVAPVIEPVDLRLDAAEDPKKEGVEEPKAKGEKKFTFELKEAPWEKTIEWFGEVTQLPFTGKVKAPEGTFTFAPAKIGNKAKQYSLGEILDVLNEGLADKGLAIVVKEKSFEIKDLAKKEEAKKEDPKKETPKKEDAKKEEVKKEDLKKELGDKKIAFDMRDMPWSKIIEWYGETTDLAFISTIKPPTGTFNFIPPKLSGKYKTYTIAEITDIINEGLAEKGFLLTRKEKSFGLRAADEAVPPEYSRKVTEKELVELGSKELVQVTIKIDALNVEDLAPELSKLKGQFGTIIPLQRSNQLILQDQAGNIRRIIETIRSIEENEKTAEMFTYTCKYVQSRDAERILRDQLGDSRNLIAAAVANATNNNRGGDPRFAPPPINLPKIRIHTITSDERLNSVIVSGPPDKIAQAKRVMAEIDRPEPGQDRVALGPPFLKTYPCTPGAAEALSLTLKDVYKASPILKITNVGTSQIMVWATPEDHMQIAKHILGSNDVKASVVENIPLGANDAEKVSITLKAMYGDVKLGGPFIDFDPNRNSLIIKATPDQIADIKLAIKGITGSGTGGSTDTMRIINLSTGDGVNLAEALKRMLEGMNKNPVRVITPAFDFPKEEPKSEPKKDPKKDATKPIDPATAKPLVSISRPVASASDNDARGDSRSLVALQLDPKEQKKDTKPKANLPEVRITAIGSRIIVQCEDPEILNLVSELTRILVKEPGEGSFHVIRLKNANATEAAKILDQWFNGTTTAAQGGGQQRGGLNFGGISLPLPFGLGGGGGGPATPAADAAKSKVRIIADPYSNSLLVRASALDIFTIQSMLEKAIDYIDDSNNAVTKTFIYGPLVNTTASEVASLLKDVFKENTGTSGTPTQTGGFPGVGFPFGGGGGGNQQPTAARQPYKLTIGIDDRTNSLVFGCSQTLYDSVKSLVEKLDEAAKDSAKTVKIVSIKGIDPYLLQDAMDALQGRRTVNRNTGFGNQQGGFGGNRGNQGFGGGNQGFGGGNQGFGGGNQGFGGGNQGFGGGNPFGGGFGGGGNPFGGAGFGGGNPFGGGMGGGGNPFGGGGGMRGGGGSMGGGGGGMRGGGGNPFGGAGFGGGNPFGGGMGGGGNPFGGGGGMRGGGGSMGGGGGGMRGGGGGKNAPSDETMRGPDFFEFPDMDVPSTSYLYDPQADPTARNPFNQSKLVGPRQSNRYDLRWAAIEESQDKKDPKEAKEPKDPKIDPKDPKDPKEELKGNEIRAPRSTVNVSALEELGIIVVVAQNQKDLQDTLDILEKIRELSKGAEVKLEVYPLEYADCTAIVNILNQILARINVGATSTTILPPRQQGGFGGGQFGGQQGGQFGGNQFGGNQFGGQQGAIISTAQNVLLIPLPRFNSILIGASHQRMDDLIKEIKKLDRPISPQASANVFPLKKASAQTVATTIQNFWSTRYPGETNTLNQIRVLPDTSTNTIFVQAAPADLEEIRGLIEKIDGTVSSAINSLKIVRVRNAYADELANTILQAITNGILPQTPGTTGVNNGGALGNLLAGGNPFGGNNAGANANAQNRNTLGSQSLFNTTKTTSLRFMSGQGAIIESGFLEDVHITADVRSNNMIISAPEKTMPLIEAILRELDVPSAAQAYIKVYTLKRADAVLAANLISQLFSSSGTARTGGNAGANPFGANAGANGANGANGAPRPLLSLTGDISPGATLIDLRIAVDERTNSLIIAGTDNDQATIEAIVSRLEDSVIQNRVNHIYRLRNAASADVATTLQTFLNNSLTVVSSSNILSPYQIGQRQVVVAAEPVTNTLLINATADYLAQVIPMIEKLDAQPYQVVVAVLLADVQLSNSEEFGVEIGLQNPIMFQRGIIPTTGVNYSTATGGLLPAGVTVNSTQTLAQVPGLNFNNPQASYNTTNPVGSGLVGLQGLGSLGVGRISPNSSVGGFVFSGASDTFNLLIRSLKTQGRIDILSRPQIQTMDNQTGFITVGQNFPYINGASTNNVGNITPTVAYQNIGVSLRVTPRVNPDGKITMRVEPTVSAASATQINLGNNLLATVFDQQAIETTISAMDGETVAIGGLISKNNTRQENKIPWLGDLPVIGTAFRYRTQLQTRRELIVILTPHIVRNQGDLDRIKCEELKRLSLIEKDIVKNHGDPFKPGRGMLTQVEQMQQSIDGGESTFLLGGSQDLSTTGPAVAPQSMPPLPNSSTSPMPLPSAPKNGTSPKSGGGMPPATAESKGPVLPSFNKSETSAAQGSATPASFDKSKDAPVEDQKKESRGWNPFRQK